jgi:TRAP-type mannitol/chloroaromatic compound transport system substrate-binding protein
VSGYPRDLPGSGATPERLAQSIAAMSDGHLKVTVYPPDTVVRALEEFDAVSTGAADMYSTVAPIRRKTSAPSSGTSRRRVFIVASQTGCTASWLIAIFGIGAVAALVASAAIRLR